jgi:hypothetical protein
MNTAPVRKTVPDVSSSAAEPVTAVEHIDDDDDDYDRPPGEVLPSDSPHLLEPSHSAPEHASQPNADLVADFPSLRTRSKRPVPDEDDDNSVVAERAGSETRTTNSLSDNVEASWCNDCLVQQEVSIIGVKQGTSGRGERCHDALLCKMGHAQEVDEEAGNIKDLRKAETTPVRHVKYNLTNLSTVGCRVVAQLDSPG